MTRLAILAAAALAACAKRDASEERARDSEVVTPPAAPTAVEQRAPHTPDPQALGELIAAAPSSRPAPTDPSGTLVGTDTKKSADPAASAAPAASSEPMVSAGRMTVQPLLSSPILERAGREQIYWQLAKSCRMPNGELPPAESVTLQFTIRSDGTVFPASVRAEAKSKAYEGVADCVERVFAASGFRGPAEGRGTTPEVAVTWPSVD